MSSILENLSFSRFKAYFRVVEPLHLPFFTGSTVRGALGHALRRVRHGKRENCRQCTVHAQCHYGNLYAYLFESSWDHPLIEPFHQALSPRLRRETYPQPFILDPPPGGVYKSGDLLVLGFTLVGRAVAFLPFMAYALNRMGEGGLGRGRGRIALELIVNGFPSESGGDIVVYSGEVMDFDSVRRWADASFPVQHRICEARVRFLTPFRYRYEGKLGRPLTFEILMRNLLRRFALLSVHSPVSADTDNRTLLARAAAVATRDDSSLEWYRWQRHSSRPEQEGWMNLDGFVGEIVFAGELNPFTAHLKMGEFLNVGKDGSFGLGKYEVSLVREPV